jgi:hypothetical protein
MITQGLARFPAPSGRACLIFAIALDLKERRHWACSGGFHLAAALAPGGPGPPARSMADRQQGVESVIAAHGIASLGALERRLADALDDLGGHVIEARAHEGALGDLRAGMMDDLGENLLAAHHEGERLGLAGKISCAGLAAEFMDRGIFHIAGAEDSAGR